MFYPFARSGTRKGWFVWLLRGRVDLWRRSHRHPLLPVGLWVVRRDASGMLEGPYHRLGVDTMLRPDVLRNGNEHPLSAADEASFKGFPGIRSFFLSTRYDGVDAVRQPGLLIVSVSPSGWVWTLKDSTAGTQLRVQAPSWDEVQLLTEGLLNDPRAPWVVDPYASQKRNGRRR